MYLKLGLAVLLLIISFFLLKHFCKPKPVQTIDLDADEEAKSAETEADSETDSEDDTDEDDDDDDDDDDDYDDDNEDEISKVDSM